MSIFNRFDEDEYLNTDDGPMFGGADRYEERKQRLERAKDIASGITSGMFEQDDEVFELVNELTNPIGVLTAGVHQQKKGATMAVVTAQVVGGKAQPQTNVETIAEVKKAMGLGSTYAASINGEPADDNDVLEDGQFVTFAPQVKGAKVILRKAIQNLK